MQNGTTLCVVIHALFEILHKSAVFISFRDPFIGECPVAHLWAPNKLLPSAMYLVFTTQRVQSPVSETVRTVTVTVEGRREERKAPFSRDLSLCSQRARPLQGNGQGTRVQHAWARMCATRGALNTNLVCAHTTTHHVRKYMRSDRDRVKYCISILNLQIHTNLFDSID